jgi:hypothetical protein
MSAMTPQEQAGAFLDEALGDLSTAFLRARLRPHVTALYEAIRTLGETITDGAARLAEVEAERDELRARMRAAEIDGEGRRAQEGHFPVRGEGAEPSPQP